MIIRDGAGNWVYPGRVHRQLAFETWGAAALPSWLTLGTTDKDASCTATFFDMSAQEAYVRIATKSSSPTSGDSASLYGPQVNLVSIEAIMLTLEGVCFDANKVGPFIQFGDTLASAVPTVGSRFWQQSTYYPCNIYWWNGANDVSVIPQIIWSGGTFDTNEYKRKQTIGYSLSRQRQPWGTDVWWGQVWRDSGLWHSQALTGAHPMATGVVYPTVQVVTKEAVQHYMQFERLVLDVWTF